MKHPRQKSIFIYLTIFFPLLLNTVYSENITTTTNYNISSNNCTNNCSNNGICHDTSCICYPMYYGELCQYINNFVYDNNITNTITNTITNNITNNTNSNHNTSIFSLDTTLVVIFSISGVIIFIFSIILFAHIHRLIKRRRYKRMTTQSISMLRTWAR